MIESFASLIIAFQSVAVDYSKVLVEAHSPTTLLIEFAIYRHRNRSHRVISLIFKCEGTFNIVKVKAVQSY